ncbi:MAG: nucleotidyltransferase domain-containing protein [Thermoproteales archaeon]|nr:nucleotidyltransferase domain-containing protein [Thermoproteales archaeon]RLE63425.1 MAG: nucleotidyltransferase domain-containing protein [Thermoprotei archaeon]
MKEYYRTLLKELLKALKNRFKEKLYCMVIYGSVARDEAKPDSDIDILLVIEDLPKSRLERQKLFIEVEEKIRPFIDELWDKGIYIDFSPIILTPSEAQRLRPLYLDMVDDAVIIYEKNGFFTNILRRLKKKLKEMNARKVHVGKRWYWVLKEPYVPGEVIEVE